MGITRVMLGEYLKGHRGAGGEKTARGIAKVLGITTDEVFGLPKRRRADVAVDPDVVHPVLGSRPGAHEARARRALLHEGGHYLLRRARHTHADVIQLTLCLAAPWATVRAAVRAGALAPEALMLRQRFAPQWLLEWRCEVIARAFNSFEVA